VLTNTFNAIDRVKTTSDVDGMIAACSWIGPGYRELRRVCGNGTSLSYLDDAGSGDAGYDEVKRIVLERCFLPDGVTTFVDRTYVYNRADMRIREERNEAFGFTDVYTYDSFYRIQQTDLDQMGTGGGVPRTIARREYVLDGVGNRRQLDTAATSASLESVAYEVNDVNEYTTVGAVVRTHDNNGNLIDDGDRTYAFDVKDRLVRVQDKATGAAVSEYLYFAENRRARKTVYDESGAVGKATLYAYDGWQVCEEQDGRTSATEVTYVWGPHYVDELVQFERTAVHPHGAGKFYTHQDARKSVVAVTDDAANVVERNVYDDFGNTSRANNVDNPYLFQGRRFDPETGFYYFRNRYYDPSSGRFLQRDPVWDAENVGNQ